MQATQKLIQAISERNWSTCPVCHGPSLDSEARRRLQAVLELAYEAGAMHGRAKARWYDMLAGCVVASAVWALVCMFARAL
jgi:hypothetical protein